VFGSHEQLAFIHTNRLHLNKSKRIIYISYHHYSPTPSGGLLSTKEETCDTTKSKATHTQI
jgi:hypothetical protein